MIDMWLRWRHAAVEASRADDDGGAAVRGAECLRPQLWGHDLSLLSLYGRFISVGAFLHKDNVVNRINKYYACLVSLNLFPVTSSLNFPMSPSVARSCKLLLKYTDVAICLYIYICENTIYLYFIYFVVGIILLYLFKFFFLSFTGGFLNWKKLNKWKVLKIKIKQFNNLNNV